MAMEGVQMIFCQCTCTETVPYACRGSKLAIHVLSVVFNLLYTAVMPLCLSCFIQTVSLT